MASVIYAKFTNSTDGEVTQTGYEKHVQIESFSEGIANQTSGLRTQSSAGRGQCDPQNIHITCHMGSHSMPLFKMCQQGVHYDKIEFKFLAQNAEGKPYEFYKVTITKAYIQSYQLTDSMHSNSLPMESLSINWATIERNFVPLDSAGKTKGNLTSSYDATLHKTA